VTADKVTVLVAGDPGTPAPLAVPAGPEIEVIGHVGTGNEAIARVLTELPDVLLLDTRIAEPDARAVCRRIREWAPATRVLAATEHDDEHAYTTVVAGAAGAVLYDIDEATVVTTLCEVARGESVLLARMATRLLHDLDAWARRSADPLYPPPTLTATEREVLARIGEGVDPATIAAAHSVTSHLVNLHTGFAVAKLHRYVLGSERIAADRKR
jgi:two-component system, NarL family, response regulator DevR